MLVMVFEPGFIHLPYKFRDVRPGMRHDLQRIAMRPLQATNAKRSLAYVPARL